MDKDEKVLKEVNEQIGMIGTALEECRTNITDIQEKQKSLEASIPGEVQQRQADIIDELVPKIFESQQMTSLIKSTDETRAMIERMNFESEEKGIKVDQHKAAVLDWMQHGLSSDGISPDRGISDKTKEFFASEPYQKEVRRLQEDTDWKGGVFITPQMSMEVIKLANDENPLVPLCRNINITGTNSFKFPKRTALASATRTGEGRTGTESQSKYGDQEITAHNLDVLTKATRDILADFTLTESFVTEDAAEAMGLKMGVEIIDGSAGTGLEGITINGDIASVTALETVTNSISTKDFPAMYTTLKTKYRANSTFLFNSTSLGLILAFQSTTGAFIWQQTLADGPQSTVIGRPYALMENLDSPADNTFPVFIGDFNKAYFVVNRTPIEIIRDPFSSKPNVEFLFVMRNGGAVVLAEGIKKLNIVET